MSTGTAPKAVVAVSRTMKLKIIMYFKIFSFCCHVGRSLRKYQHTVRAKRIDAPVITRCRGQQKLVLIAGNCLCYISVPVAVLLCLHGVIVAFPSVERSDD